MRRLARSLLRVVLATGLVLGALISVFGCLVRQPSFRALECQAAGRSDPRRLEAHVRFLSETVLPRNASHPANLDAAADYIAEHLAEHGGRVEQQIYTAGGVDHRNIRARYGPPSGPVLVVGAHYDVCRDLPGADDNASGVAGLLEIGRLLGAHPPPVPVELVAFSTEEPPFFGSPEMGSAVYASRLRDSGAQVAGMICLDMIGYYTERQPSPHWILRLLYPGSGDFILVVGRWRDRALARHVKAGIKGAGGVSACSLSAPPILGADLSDHRNFWSNGYMAVMVTDTAFIRNPHYHGASDRPETLDYQKMAGVVDGVFSAVMGLGPAAGR